jgi:nucleotide-binding universal stress UspA family protein
MLRYERGTMMVTFVVMAAIWITIGIVKPYALLFAVCVLLFGFLARGLHKGFRLPAVLTRGGLGKTLFPEAMARLEAGAEEESAPASLLKQLGSDRPVTAIMVAARGVTPTLRYAVEQARLHNAQLFILFVREVFTTIPVSQSEQDDPEAMAVFKAVRAITEGMDVTTIYAVSDDTAWTIADNAAIAGVDMLILGHSRRAAVTRVLRGDLMQQLGSLLPEEIRLVIVG